MARPYQDCPNVGQVRRHVATLASASLPMYGSLYYAKNLDHPSPCQYVGSGTNDTGEAFAVGPTTHSSSFDRGRAHADIYRGPYEYCSTSTNLSR